MILRLVCVAAVFAVCARADTGIPMLAVTWPGMALALVPVVLIEWWIMRPRLAFGTRRLVKLTLIANAVSTLVGIPLAWLAYFVFELIALPFAESAKLPLDKPWEKLFASVITAPWLYPIESDLYWMVPAATLALLPAYFVASWLIEYRMMRRLIRKNPQGDFEKQVADPKDRTIRSAMFAANLASYAFLAALTVFWLVMSLVKGPQPD